MKRIILLCGLLTAFFCAFSNPVEFRQSIPASGTTISTFNFELEFDIDKALEAAVTEAPGVNVGLGYMGGGSGNKYGIATLYKGDEKTGEVLGTSMGSTFNGKSEGFIVNGNKATMNFDESIPIIPNQEYTVTVTNIFYLYKENLATRVNSTKNDFTSNPIVLKFIGADLGDSKIFVEGSNIEKDSSLEKIENVEFDLSAPFSINSGAEVLIKEGDNIIAKTSNLKVSPSDETKLIADFGNEANLYLGHSYTLVLPAESVSLATNSNASNLEFSVDVCGLSQYSIKLVSTNIEKDDNGIPTSITFLYDMPDRTTLSRQTGTSEAAIGYGLYNNGAVEGRYMGQLIENGRGFKWTFSKDNWIPETEYTFRKEANSIYVCDDSGKHLPEYVNEMAEVSFTTPSVEAWGYPDMEFKTPVITSSKVDYDENYIEGMTCQHISSIEFWLKENWYYLDGERYNLTLHPKINTIEKNKVNLYEMTAEGDKLISTVNLNVRYDINEVCGVGTVSLNTSLYEGKRYKLVIPEGYFTVIPFNNLKDQSKVNLIRNKEFVLTFEGATPNKVILQSCNYADNSVVSKLYTVNWVFEGTYQLSENINTVKCDRVTVNQFGEIPSTQEKTAFLSEGIGKTYVYVKFLDEATGEPTNVSNKTTYTLTIPKGMLINTINDEIVNDEIVLHLKGGEETVPAMNPSKCLIRAGANTGASPQQTRNAWQI